MNTHEEIIHYRARAEQGDVYAQYALGEMYQNGKGVTQDYAEAVRWYRKAARQEFPAAQLNLGLMYQRGKGVPQDDYEAFDWCMKAAKQGNADAMFWIGWMQQSGRAISQDDAKALFWFRKAAELGSALAQYNMGEMYQNGKGVPRDYAEAVKWYCKAAEQGYADAQFSLGLMYRFARGVPMNDTEAAKWYRKAAEQGHAAAQNRLGHMYLHGTGVPQDYAEAVKCYQKAAEQGDKDAPCNLAQMYENGEGVPQDYAEAAKWRRRAAEQGGEADQYNLARIYQKGEGVPQDDAEAVKWYRKAAEQGDADAQFSLGLMYQNGEGVPQDDAEAVKWYRKAAEQGDADAKNKLDQIKAERIKVSKDKKSREHHLRDANECKALLDACTPHLYIHNAFRISGIPIDASTRDIKRRIDDLKAAAEMGDLKNELIHAFALDPMPSLDQIREAAQKLQNPEQRIIDEFFWFWPQESGKNDNDSALRALRNCDYGSALKIWSDALSENHPPTCTVAKHNLAVMFHIKALDAEQNALKSNLSAEKLFIISQDWRTCFKWWEELTDDEAFWSLVTDRIRIIDDPRLTTGFARRMRATLPEALDMINALLAIEFAENDKLPQATNHINYMKETHQGKDNVPKTLSVIIKPFETRVNTAVKTATDKAKKQPTQAAKAALELLQAIAEPLKVIQFMLPPEDHERIDLCDTVADACLTCQIAYARESEDWTASLEILDAALKYAASKETIDRLTDSRSNVATNKYVGSLMKKIKDVDKLNFSIADKMNDIKNNILPYLSSIKRLSGMSDDLYEKCADAVARYVRELFVSEYNKNSNLPAALRILEVAISVARGHEVREKLQEDKTQLINIQKETTNHNLQMQIRSDEIEITKEFVRYNNQKIPVSMIQGIKYGIFITQNQYRQTSASYLIEITDDRSSFGVPANALLQQCVSSFTTSRHIKIECKRLLRNETQAEIDFNNILDALFHQVVPSLIQRLAENIVSGMPLQVGDCRLTTKGIYITTGALMWKKETLVPFPDLKFNKYSGQIAVSSVKDTGIKTSMAIRDIWNSALLEFITKAVVEMKKKS